MAKGIDYIVLVFVVVQMVLLDIKYGCYFGFEVVFIDSFGAICDYLKKNVTSGDLVVTMGAGDIWKVADEYIQWLRRNS